jgi:hypothetical protein
MHRARKSIFSFETVKVFQFYSAILQVFWAIFGLLLPRSPKNFLQTCMLADLTIQWPNGGFINKFSLVVKVRLIKGKIDHPPILNKNRVFQRSRPCV